MCDVGSVMIETTWMGWGGKTVAIGGYAKLRGPDFRRGSTIVRIAEIDRDGHAVVSVVRSSPKSPWCPGNRMTVGTWYLEARAE